MINLKTNNWKIENIETILFDKDGTLIDLHYFWGKMTELRACAVIKKYGLCESFFVRVMTSIVCIFADICCFAVPTCQITPSRKGRKNESYTEGNDTS